MSIKFLISFFIDSSSSSLSFLSSTTTASISLTLNQSAISGSTGANAATTAASGAGR